MINLILDTNAWIYLANGYNPDTEKYNRESHFQMVDWIQEKLLERQLVLYSNDIIELEWKRNKQFCLLQIDRLQTTLQHSQKYVNNSRKKPNFDTIRVEEESKQYYILDRIDKNIEHIKKVEQIIETSIKIPITDKQKLEVVNWAIEKRAPFHNKPNSVADALIFLSIVKYFDFHPEAFVVDTIFVSNNSKDFSEDKNKKVLHPDLQKLIDLKPIMYETNLASVMGLGTEIIKEYAEYTKSLHAGYYVCDMDCKGVEYGMAEVVFNEKDVFKIPKSDEINLYNPNQTRIEFRDGNDLTIEELKFLDDNNFDEIRVGYCNWCYATHILCRCGEVHATYGHEEVICNCGYDLSKIWDTTYEI